MQPTVITISQRRRGFTLTELLVVMAITTILLGLLFIPIVQGFNLTRSAQNRVQVQAQTRRGIQQLARELGQAVYVFDNGAAPIVFPLKFAINTANGGTATTPVTWLNGQVVYPARVTFAKVDFISGIRLGDPSKITDPTTRDAIGGSEIRFPLAPGTRVVRYFIGLRDNTSPYENLYLGKTHSAQVNFQNTTTEFPFSRDSRLNPFVLYRAEFDPEDPNLFNFSNNRSFYNSAVDNNGGFNDPDFFYNQNAASSTNPVNGKTGNGLSYAENWKAISTAVVDGPNQDVVSWIKDDSGDLILSSPMRPLISFLPSTVPGDSATPGFLTAAAAEVPNAVPTMYTTQQAHWTMPYSLTFYRAPSRPASADKGALRVTIDGVLQPDGTLRPHVTLIANDILATPANQLYCARLLSTGEIFIKTPNLTFAIDPERGLIRTGFPPLAGGSDGVPMIRLTDGSIVPMQAGPWPDVNYGEVVPTLFRLNTRVPQADSVIGVPSNQGWEEVDLWDNSTLRYYLDGVNLTTPVLTTSAGTYVSPLACFGNMNLGNLNPAGGLMVAAGTERVAGPDLQVTPGGNQLGLVAYYRSPGAIASVVKKSTLVTDPNNALRKIWTPLVGQRNYIFDQDTRLNSATNLLAALVRFDNTGGPGLPARPATDSGTLTEREIQITYLWQNNYARRNSGVVAENGQPTDAAGKILGEVALVAPEPDVVKADYATRDLMAVNLGVNVYDSQTRQTTSISLNDKVRVNNSLR